MKESASWAISRLFYKAIKVFFLFAIPMTYAARVKRCLLARHGIHWSPKGAVTIAPLASLMIKRVS